MKIYQCFCHRKVKISTSFYRDLGKIFLVSLEETVTIFKKNFDKILIITCIRSYKDSLSKDVTTLQKDHENILSSSGQALVKTFQESGQNML